MSQIIKKLSYIGLSLTLSAGAYGEEDLLASIGFSEFNLPEFNEYSVPVVLTATRLQQHQADVPASVTILDEDFIKRVSAQNFAELLRFVPGMMVGPDSNYNADSVHYHGGPAALPKNLQVLVNGRSMYRSALATVSWYELPVAMEDIKRIEVVRGPNAASYGANAYQAIVNILTKHPADTYGATVSFQSGNNGEENFYLKHGGRIGSSDYRVSLTQKTTDRFARGMDSKQSRFMNLDHFYQNATMGEFNTSFVLSDTTRDLESDIDFQVNQNKLGEQRLELGSIWTRDLSSKHQIKVSGYLIQSKQRQRIELADVPVAILDDNLRALYQLDPEAADAIAQSQDASLFLDTTEEIALFSAFYAEYAPFTNIAMVDGYVDANLDETRYDIEIQDTYVYSPSLTFISGSSFRRDIAKSDMYFDGEIHNDTTRLFASATWQASDSYNFHLGAMAEKESDADLVFAPRAAVNYKLTPSESLRFVYSESVRSPDLFEQDANWQLKVQTDTPVTTGTTFYQTQQGPGNLDHQYIRSYELGYYGRFVQSDAELDVRLFQENLTDVFYQSLTIDSIETINDIDMEFTGIEWQYSFEPWRSSQIRWVGAYVDASTNLNELDASNRAQVLLRVYAKNTHTITWLQDWGRQTDSSASLHLIDSYDEFNDNEDSRTKIYRLDGKVTHTFTMPVPDASVDLSINVQHDFLSDPYIWRETIYEDDTRVQFAVAVNF